MGERKARVAIKGNEIVLKWREDRGTFTQRAVHSINGFENKIIQNFVGEIPPDSHTGQHRHVNEAIIYIVFGKGYSIVEGERYDWEAGDFLSVPPFGWHQHFNTDPNERARYIGTTCSPLIEYMRMHDKELGEPAGKNAPAEPVVQGRRDRSSR